MFNLIEVIIWIIKRYWDINY